MLAGLKSHQLYEPALLGEIYGFIKPHIKTAQFITKGVHQALINDMDRLRILKMNKCGYGKKMSNLYYYEFCYNRCIAKIIHDNHIFIDIDHHIYKFISSYLHNQTDGFYLVLEIIDRLNYFKYRYTYRNDNAVISPGLRYSQDLSILYHNYKYCYDERELL